MKRFEDVREMLNKEINDAIRLGKTHEKLGHKEGLDEYCGWYVIEALCEVLNMNACYVWNRIVRECPNMGEYTEC